MRLLNLFGRKDTSVGYCSATGCKYAITNMHSNNGITRAPNGTFYVADASLGGLSILEAQEDNTLVLIDEVPLGEILSVCTMLVFMRIS